MTHSSASSFLVPEILSKEMEIQTQRTCENKKGTRVFFNFFGKAFLEKLLREREKGMWQVVGLYSQIKIIFFIFW